jgi:hypothetical protein
MAEIDVDFLADMAQEVSRGDPIDWSDLKVSKEHAYKMIAASIIEQFDRDVYTDHEKIVMLATITNLVVENFLLHTRLLTSSSNDS